MQAGEGLTDEGTEGQGGEMSAGVEEKRRYGPCQDAWRGEEPVNEIKPHGVTQQRGGKTVMRGQDHFGKPRPR